MGFLKAAKLYGVPKTTLERKVKKARTNSYTSQDAAAKKLGRFETVFTMDQEKTGLIMFCFWKIDSLALH